MPRWVSRRNFGVPFGFHVVRRVLSREETGELQDGGVVVAADVPPRRGLLLGEEHLGAAEVVDVGYGDGVRDRLEAFQDVQLCLIAWDDMPKCTIRTSPSFS